MFPLVGVFHKYRLSIRGQHDLQSWEVSEWPWDDTAKIIFTILPLTRKGKDVIWVVFDRLSKVDHFMPTPTIDSTSDLAHVYVQELVRLHGVHKTIDFDTDAKFVSKFQESLQSTLCAPLRLRTVVCPKTGPVREINPNSERYVEVLCPILARELGISLTTCRVCL
jgi:hypothetical protein